ncbi:Uncharacterized protein ChrSV_2432 [Chromobacterium vaccinii]|nr:Uncharacterized protein ChrSW_2432 [Chromobacterium vaccinii]QND89889.1 Uncharacterized protein ChrSV_2432 [Chromobacterium vaccinii]
MQHPVWWEKTVEYYFVRKLLDDETAISPLDGKHEILGDALLKSDLGWILIEFKKDQSCFSSEKAKFKNWDIAQNLLANRDAHHFLIFGVYDSAKTPSFNVRGCTYFSRQKPNGYVGMKASGVSIDVFTQYLQDFMAQRKLPDGDEGSGVSVEAYAQVLGVNQKGDVVTCASLQEFGFALEKTLALKKQHVREITYPSRSKSRDRGMSR